MANRVYNGFVTRNEYHNAVAEYKIMAMRAVEKSKELNKKIQEKDAIISKLERRLNKYEQQAICNS